MDNKEKQLHYRYNFTFDDGTEKEFIITLDDDLNLVENSMKNFPDWAKLINIKCPNCPLDFKTVEYCPLAVNLADVIDFFKDMPSFEKAKINCETNERWTSKHTTVQSGISSLMGIIMASGGCPIIGKLKPLVRFHLPFASIEETEYRVLSMYVLEEYFNYLEGKEPDWKLEKLKATYDQIQIVNRNIIDKIYDLEMHEACTNAVIALGNFADFISINLEDRDITHVRNFVKDFINK
ncbi:MAG: hypothetical protein KJ799_14295 [Bacteroidetes bacterium]|nr:hypothetical protein [Bacteroidota bacterium]MBU1678197.1 hypothetical protein [Bacteroidota bacterium]MBU2507875.1 hypothetical protein [Bacteroidota bacterium]